MSDTFTTSLGLLLQETGNNDNTWGALLNTQVIQYVEDKFCNDTNKTLTGDVTLTQAECRKRSITFGGSVTSLVTVPAVRNNWMIINAMTGTSALTMKAAGGTTIRSIPQGFVVDVYCDGTDIDRRDISRVGELFFHAGPTVPAGSLECDGSEVSREGATKTLFSVIGTTWGTAAGGTFTLPNAKTLGKFVRSRSASVAVGVSQNEMIGPHSHDASGASWLASSNSVAAGGSFTVYGPGVVPVGVTGPISNNSGTENRPANLSAILCIRI